MSDEFVIQTDKKELKFIANRETGRWILTNDNLNNVKERLSTPNSNSILKGTKMAVLNMGRACNLRCVYCSVGDKKEENTLLTEEIGKKALERIAEMKQDEKQVVFHGSEPMMNYSLIKKLTTYGHYLDKQIQFCMQSNGTLLTKEKIKELKDLGVGIGISLDGLAKHQNCLRPFKGGRRKL